MAMIVTRVSVAIAITTLTLLALILFLSITCLVLVGGYPITSFQDRYDTAIHC